MKKLAPGLLAGTAALALSITMLQPAQANPFVRSPQEGGAAVKSKPDNRPGPKTKQQQRLREKALTMLDNGSAQLKAQPGGGSTVQLADGKFVEFPIDKQDKVFTILSEFGDQGSGKLGTTPGPLHNQIPQPDRSVNNSTAWVPDFNKAHYEEMFNGAGDSFKDYYRQLSSGRYTATNTVEDWVKVPGNASTYGDNTVEDFGGSWAFIRDSGNAWYQQQLTSGKTPAEIDAYLSQFDVWDRYDFDGDGNFNEADGYIDHFQAVHAGEGEDAGGGAQGADAIWSHRWYAYGSVGQSGPSVGDQQNLLGGTQIGQSKYFIGDYTVEAENGGLGVFAHEFGHDLGLPDFYDTNAGENGTAFWTLMSSGSWLGDGTQDIGTKPGLMGPEEKYQLHWLDYSEVNPGKSGRFTLGPSQHTYSGADQAVKVNLPDVTTKTPYTTPPEGTHAWYTGRGDNYTSTLTRSVAAASKVTVKASSWYQIEAGYDYLYGEYSTDNGATWQSAGAPITGNSAKGGWASLSYAYAPNGQPSLFRFRYTTDGGVNEAGAFIDSIEVATGRDVFTDGAENGNNGWTPVKFSISTGTESKTTDRYYLLENRQYVGYDSTLKTGPYQFSFAFSAPDKVEHFPFQDGMLVWLVDNAYADNNTSKHPGHGYALPVDVRPNSLTYPDGSSPSNRREPFDATFGLQATDPVCLHKEVATDNKGGYTTLAACQDSKPGVATFNDTNPNAYWDSTNPQNSTKVAGLGVKATVTSEDASTGNITVSVVNPAR
ncbi:MAG TPA: immune inhibitor A domain-containing protein [Nocardioides sp.]|nr:immune inhibitor A domain-containing protein [Nocardioides sp.]